MIILLVSAFASACTCMGGGDSGSGFNHIYAQNISLQCLTSNESVIGTVDPVSKDLYITCHVGDRFVIEYEITPSNATTTQVNWSFDTAGVGIVEPYRNAGYTRNKSTKEQVEFEAKARSGSKYKTTLTFTVHELNKYAKAYIEVYDKVEELNSFIEPENLDFDSTTNTLTWSPVTNVIKTNGSITAAKLSGGYPVGLVGYELITLDPATSEPVGEPILLAKNQTSYEGLQAGTEYAFKVKALGDGLNTLSGDYTDEFKFYKLECANEISNKVDAKFGGTGEISFKAPLLSSESVVYYYGVNSSDTYTPYRQSTAVSTQDRVSYTLDHNFFVNKADKDVYNIEIVSYPKDYNATIGYAMGGEDDSVRYYPSDPSTPYIIQKLVTPNVEIASARGSLTIAGVSFSNVSLSSYISLGVDKTYTSNYEQGYYYKLFIEGSLQTPVKEGYVKDGNISLEGRTSTSYVIEVTTVGNAYTISSANETFRFNVLANLTDDNISLRDDVLHHETEFTTGGIELFFVSTDATHKAEYSTAVVIDTDSQTDFNLQQLGLNAGGYDIYAKSLSYVYENYQNAVVVPTTFEKILSIDVAPSISSNMITKDGYIMFKKLSAYDNYQVIVNRKAKVDVDYNEEQIVNIYAPTEENIRNGLLTYQVGETDIYGHDAKISFETIVESYINDFYTGLDIKGFFSSTHQFIYSFVTVGEDDGTTNVISSSPTTTFEIQRYAPVSTIKLQNYKLVYDRVGTSNMQQYTVTLYTYNTSDNSLKNTYEFKNFVGQTNSKDEVEVDLYSLVSKTGNKTFAELVDMDAINKVSVGALGADGKVNSPAILNSVPTEASFGFTTKPHSLTMNEYGTVNFKTDVNTNEVLQYQYIAYFYLAEDDGDGVVYTLLPKYTINRISATLDMVGDETVAVLNVDVGDVLAANQDKVIAITILETKTDKFNGLESDPIFATRISAPTLSRATVSGNDRIVWSAIDNANAYDIDVTVAGDPDFMYSSTGVADTYFSITDRVNDATTPWMEGSYTLSVIARSSAEVSGNNSFTTPYVLTSVASYAEVQIVTAMTNVFVGGTILSWDNVCPGVDEKANYTLDYTLADGTTGTENLGDALSFNASGFKPGTNTFTITPSINFEASGTILIGTPQLNSIDKWKPITGMTSLDGNLIFRVEGATNADTTYVELYTGKGELISPDKYILGIPEEETVGEGDEAVTYLKYTAYLTNMTEGELTFKAKVKSPGLLDSDFSEEYTGTKIAAVSDFEKVGEYFTWTAQPGISFYDIYGIQVNTGVELFLTLSVEEGEDGVYTPYILGIDDITGELIEVTIPGVFDYDADTNKFSLIFDEGEFFGTVTGDINFTITPLTMEPGYFSGNSSAPITLTKLNANTYISVSNGMVVVEDYIADGSAMPTSYTISIYKLKIDSETGETVRDDSVTPWTQTASYINIEGGYNITPIDLNTIGFKEEGNYEVEVQYFGDGNTVISSDVISNMSLEKLSVSTLSTLDGEITWDAVDGAESYILFISDGVNEYQYLINGSSDKIILKETDLTTLYTPTQPDIVEPEPPIEESQPEPEPEVQVASIVDGHFKFMPGLLYTVKVKANSATKLYSDWSKEFFVKKLYAPTDVRTKSSSEEIKVNMEVVTEGPDGTITTYEERTIAIGTPIISWQNSNSNALRFEYHLQYSDSIIYQIPYNSQCSYILRTDLPIGIYGIQLKVYGNTTAGSDNIGYLTSDFSISCELQYIDDVNTPTVSNGYLSWSEVSSAYAYRVTAYKTSEYNNYLNNEGSVLPDSVLTTTTGSTTFNYTTCNLSANPSYSGSYTFVINALTRPTDNIVTTDGEKSNRANIFKPGTFTDYKVKNGRLYWKISVEEVKDFVAAQAIEGGTNLSILTEGVDLTNNNKVAQEVLSYALRKINMKTGENITLEEQIKHIINVKLEINGVAYVDTPSEAAIVNAEGNQILVESGYTTDGACIEYYYDVAIEPEINNETEEPEEPEESEDGEEEPTEPDVVEPTAIRNTNGAGIEYVPGMYTIRISATGNSDVVAPVVNGGYTASITAYKPNTPKTWTTNGADVYNGKVQWELSTTEKSTIDNFDYFKNYKITAIGVADTTAKTVVRVNVDDTYNSGTLTNTNLTDNYLYYRDLKDTGTNEGLFTISAGTNRIIKDTYYRILISTEGTADSTELGEGETIYLNSNECVVNNPVNILDKTKEFKIEMGSMTWQTSMGSTATELYIYGPFNCWNATKTAVASSWDTTEVSDTILAKIDNVYYGNYDGLTVEEVNKYKNMLSIIPLSEVDGIRRTDYNITDMVYNDKSFGAGGYIIKTKELGDGNGVVDSDLSAAHTAIKLGIAAVRDNEEDETSIMQTAGWVGVADSKIYKLSADGKTWQEKYYDPDAPNEKVGVFTWNPVAGANTYEVHLFYIAPGADYGEWIRYERVRETYYNLPNGEEYNKEGLYFIRIMSMHTTSADINLNTPNYFTADFKDSTEHERVPVPSNLVIYGSGDIEWNNGQTPTSVGGYRVQFNYGADGLSTEIIAENGTDSIVPVLNMGTGNQNGTVDISIKAVAVSGNGKLNSGYCTAVKVTRLADPDMRILNGVLYWGNSSGSDPLTATEFILDDNDMEVIGGYGSYNTYMKYYTEIESHNTNYRATADETTFTVGVHTFKTMYQGSGGGSGSTMSGTENFYISSNQKTLTATKLAAPEVKNVTMDVASEIINMVKWKADLNAKGYKIRVFSNMPHPMGISYYEKVVSAETLLELLTNGTTTDTSFYVENEGTDVYVYFKLAPVVEDFALNSTGGDLFVYVQAIGSGLDTEGTGVVDKSERPGANDLYLSSSFSTPASIGVPPNPQALEFNTNTGVLSWKMGTQTPYNIKVISSYNVTDVSESELAYWKTTADAFYQYDGTLVENTKSGDNPYPEITNRSVKISQQTINAENSDLNSYTLYIEDIIILYEKDNDGKTPLSYQLTSTAINYQLSVQAMAFVNGDTTFASDVISLSGTAPSFRVFDGGNGTIGNPYKVRTLTQLETIKIFSTKAFQMINDINFVDDKNVQTYWRAIQEFSGLLDGNSYKIENFAVMSTTADNGISEVMTMFETNNGTIKNLTIEISDKKFKYTGTTAGIQSATVTINNNGIIDNVHISGEIEIIPTGASSYNINTLVGGIAVKNSKAAIISNSSANMVLTALDDMSEMTSVGGIATYNYGTITGSHFAGTITANRVGGISAQSHGLIDRCYVEEDTNINVTNKANSADVTTLKGAVAGGIVAAMSYNSTLGMEYVKVTNSYSLATINVTKGGDASQVGYTVGGLIGTMSANERVQVKNCYTVVSIKRVTISGSSSINVYHMLGQTTDVVMTDNYYLVNVCELTVSEASVNTTGCKMVDDLAALKTALTPLKDEDGNVVYLIADLEYPALQPLV